MPTDNVLEPELVVEDSKALERSLRDPRVPTTINELAAKQGDAVKILEARVLVLETARSKAIAMTHPEDWVLYKTRDERVTGYLEDVGCERVRPIFGIRIFNVDEGRKVTADDGKSFAIIFRGCGSSGLTLDVLDAVEGIRESTEDFCKDLTGVKQEIRVRQAARANLDGKIVRELAGLGSVPIEELTRAWTGSDKKVDHCRKGRGFGTQDERHGATRVDQPQVDPPTCPHCPKVNGAEVKLVYRKASGEPGERNYRAPFYGCPNYTKHPNAKVIVDVAEWVAKQTAKAAAQQTPQPDASNGGGREPGAEG